MIQASGWTIYKDGEYNIVISLSGDYFNIGYGDDDPTSYPISCIVDMMNALSRVYEEYKRVNEASS